MPKNVIKIATRESNLAMWQAHHVKSLLEVAQPGLECQIVGMTTLGDRDKQSPLRQMGGKGVFIKELETALLDGSADIAVHSMKDVPGVLPESLAIGAICERADPRDAFVSNNWQSLDELPAGSKVGSSSQRRVLQIKAAYPHLEFADIRGNVETRLRKLDGGEFDAIILAVAGLERLQLGHRIKDAVNATVSIPAAGQGAVGVEYRTDNTEVAALLRSISHEPTETCVLAERQVTGLLEASCTVPIGVFAHLQEDLIAMDAFVASLDGTRSIRQSASGSANDAESIAAHLGRELMDAGALDLIATSL